MLATTTGPTSTTGGGPISCAPGDPETVPPAAEERTVSLADFLADVSLDANHKHLLLAVQIHAGPGREYLGDNADLARITGNYHDDGRPNKRFLLRLISELEAAGLMRRRPGGKNGKRAGLILTGPRIDLSADAATNKTQHAENTVRQPATSPVTQHGKRVSGKRAGPRTLTGPEVAKFERLATASRLSWKVEPRYEAARYAIAIIDPAGGDARLTVAKVAAVLAAVWRHGLESLKQPEHREIAAALTTAGIQMKRVPGYVAR